MEVPAIVICAPVAFVILFSGLLINIIQAALFLAIKPLSKNSYRRMNGAISEILWIQIVSALEWWAGLEVKLYTDLKTYQLMGKEHAILVPNHLSDIDIFLIWLVAQRSGCLRNAIPVTKKSVAYLPIFGWAAWFFGFVFLDRNWGKDEKKLKASFERLKDFSNPFWLTIFPEGTRITPDKLLQSREYALSRGLNVPKNVLIPRTKGFVATVEYLRPTVPAIYDVTIAVQKDFPIPSLLSVLERQPTQIYIHIKRYSMKEMPESSEGIAQWCKDIFSAKDELLEKFKSTGTFGDQEIKEFCRRSVASILVYVFVALFLYTGASILIIKFSLLSTWRGFRLVAIGLAIIATTLHIFIEYTRLPPHKAQAAA